MQHHTAAIASCPIQAGQSRMTCAGTVAGIFATAKR
jgi:hypothetical protein